MFEALISLTLLGMQPPLGNAGMEWAKELRTFSSENVIEKDAANKQEAAKDASERQSKQLDLSVSPEEISAQRIASFIDSGLIDDNGVTTAYANEQELPSWEWFEKHQNWISIDRRMLNTRGDDTLFQCWSPL